MFMLFKIFTLSLLVGICTSSAMAQDVFTISTSYQNLLSNDGKEGLLDRVLTEAFRRIGIEVDIVYTPTEKSLLDVNAGILDAEINRVAGMELQYPDLRRVVEPNMTMEFVAFARRSIVINGWESLSKLDVGLVKGWKIFEANTESFPGVVKVPTEVELFTMLRKGRIDVALYDLLTGYVVLRDLGIEGVFHLEPPLARRDMFLYVHKKHEGLLDDLALALRAMKADGMYGRIEAEVRSANGLPNR